jgi:hypothetical protein
VANVAGLVVLLVTVLDATLNGELTLVFDLTFVLVCVGAALAVRPRDFFVIGVFPPLLMAGTFAVVALVARRFVADPRDGFLQAVVSGLAHHAGYLVVGYALTLGLLALRQVALRHAGALRGRGHRVPAQRTGTPRPEQRRAGTGVPEQRRSPENRVAR